MSTPTDPTRLVVADETLRAALDLPAGAQVVGLRPARMGAVELTIACDDWPAGRCDAVVHRGVIWDVTPTCPSTPLPPDDPFNGMHALGDCWCDERHHREEGAA